MFRLSSINYDNLQIKIVYNWQEYIQKINNFDVNETLKFLFLFHWMAYHMDLVLFCYMMKHIRVLSLCTMPLIGINYECKQETLKNA